MDPDSTTSTQSTLEKGTYCPARKTDLRGPCPAMNACANHGYLPRDGRNVRAEDFASAMALLGFSFPLRTLLARILTLEHRDPKPETAVEARSFFGHVWSLISDPWAAFARFGMRNAGQVDSMGKICMNLDQLGLHGAVEHDASLTRRDHTQGDNITPQPDLIQQLLDASTDGKILSQEDLVHLRLLRIKQQMAENPSLQYGPVEHSGACGEIVFLLNAFGDGQSIPCEYARVLFEEERLPMAEGWKSKSSSWWKFGIVELIYGSERLKAMMKKEGVILTK